MAHRMFNDGLEEMLRGMVQGTYSLENAIMQDLMEHYMEGLNTHSRRKATVQLLGSASGVRGYHRNEYNMFKAIGSKTLFGSTYSNRIYPSRNVFKCLQRVSVLDLYLDEAATGKYLLLRTIEPSYNQISVTTIVEDHVGNVTLFSAYNFIASPFADANDVFPPGTIFILKEPYFKIPKIGRCMLRTDCPSDIIILLPSHPLFKLTEDVIWKNDVHYAGVVNPVMALPVPETGEDWKNRARRLFDYGKFYHAAECYRLALQEAECVTDRKGIRVLRLCLSTVYIRLQQFEAGLMCAKQVLEFQSDNAKGLFRAGRACYELRLYKEATSHFERLVEIKPEDRQAEAELTRCRKRLAEESGKFNVYDLCRESISNPCTNIDCADYVGPVEVVEQGISGRRTVVATTNIEPGTLLVVSKAFKATWDSLQTLQFNMDISIDSSSKMSLVSMLADAISKNPKAFGSMIYGLLKPPIGPVPLFCDPETQEEPIVDVDKLRAIVDEYGILLSPIGLGCDSSSSKENYGCGVFVFPSFFRHSCLPNASFCNYNDVIVIRAIRSIRAREEVSINRMSPTVWLAKRVDSHFTRDLHCCCGVCQQDQSESESCLQTRQQVLHRFRTDFQTDAHSSIVHDSGKLSDLQRLVVEAESTYAKSKHNEWKVDLFPLYYMLGNAHLIFDDFPNAILAYFKALDCFGFTRKQLTLLTEDKGNLQMLDKAYLNRTVLTVMVAIICAYHGCGRKAQARKYLGTLRALEEVLSGGDMEYICLLYEVIRDVA